MSAVRFTLFLSIVLGLIIGGAVLGHGNGALARFGISGHTKESVTAPVARYSVTGETKMQDVSDKTGATYRKEDFAESEHFDLGADDKLSDLTDNPFPTQGASSVGEWGQVRYFGSEFPNSSTTRSVKRSCGG